MAFGLLHDDFSRIKNIEQYFRVGARAYAYVSTPITDPKFDVDNSWTTKDGNNFYRDIMLHRCNDSDWTNIF